MASLEDSRGDRDPFDDAISRLQEIRRSEITDLEKKLRKAKAKILLQKLEIAKLRGILQQNGICFSTVVSSDSARTLVRAVSPSLMSTEGESVRNSRVISLGSDSRVGITDHAAMTTNTQYSSSVCHDITHKPDLISSTPVSSALCYSPGLSSCESNSSPTSSLSQSPLSPRKSLRRLHSTGKVRYRYKSGADTSKDERVTGVLAEKGEGTVSPVYDCVIIDVVESPIKQDAGDGVMSQTLATGETSDQAIESPSSLQTMITDNSAFPLFTERLETLADQPDLDDADVSAFADMPDRSDQTSHSFLTASGSASPSLLEPSSHRNVLQPESTVSHVFPPFALDVLQAECSEVQPNGESSLREGGSPSEKVFPRPEKGSSHESNTESCASTEQVHFGLSGTAGKKRKLLLQKGTLTQRTGVKSDPAPADQGMSPHFPALSQEQLSPYMPMFIPATPWPQRKSRHVLLGEDGDSGESATCSEDEATMAILPETDLTAGPPLKKRPYSGSFSRSDDSSLAEDDNVEDNDDYVLLLQISTGGAPKENAVLFPSPCNNPGATQSICDQLSPHLNPLPLPDDNAATQELPTSLTVATGNEDTRACAANSGISHVTKPGVAGTKSTVACNLTEAQKLAMKAGLPKHKCAVALRRKEDRDKLDGKACLECREWFSGNDGIHRDARLHLKQTCRHKHLHLPPDSDPSIWKIGFPDD